MSRKIPKVIFVDAGGTLFRVKGSVGKVYRTIALKFNVNLSAYAIDLAFKRIMAQSGPLAFNNAPADDIPELEYKWWENVVRKTMERADVLYKFSDFTGFFDVLYEHFATPEPWELYPDTLEALDHWQKQSIELGVISNFDSRLLAILQSLKLIEYFSSVTYSTEVGYAKPDPRIFAVALSKHDCSEQEAWHIGDSYDQDYRGAKSAGLKPILLQR